LIIIAFENFERKIESIISDYEYSKFPNRFLNTNDFEMNNFNSSKANNRIQTENYTIKNHFMRTIIMEMIPPVDYKNIISDADYEHKIEKSNSMQKYNSLSNNNISKLNKTTNSYNKQNAKSVNLKNLIKLQIDTNGKNKFRSVNIQKYFKSDPKEFEKDFSNNIKKNNALERDLKLVDVPLLGITNKLNANSNNSNNENFIKGNFYTNLFHNEAKIPEKYPRTIMPDTETSNIKFKNLISEKNQKYNIPIKTDNSVFAYRNLNFNQISKTPVNSCQEKFGSNTLYDKFKDKRQFRFSNKRVYTEINQ